MEWTLTSYDRATDLDGRSHPFTTERDFVEAAGELLHDRWDGFASATLPDGTMVTDVAALRTLIALGSRSMKRR